MRSIKRHFASIIVRTGTSIVYFLSLFLLLFLSLYFLGSLLLARYKSGLCHKHDCPSLRVIKTVISLSFLEFSYKGGQLRCVCGILLFPRLPSVNALSRCYCDRYLDISSSSGAERGGGIRVGERVQARLFTCNARGKEYVSFLEDLSVVIRITPASPGNNERSRREREGNVHPGRGQVNVIIVKMFFFFVSP